MDRQENLDHLIAYCHRRGYPITKLPGELNWFKINGLLFDHTIGPEDYRLNLIVDFVKKTPRILYWEEGDVSHSERFNAFLKTDPRYIHSKAYKHIPTTILGPNLMVLRGE